MNVIEIENVSFAYASGNVLEDVSLQIEKGALVGLFGPNGGGKTTLLNLLMGFLTPSHGTIKIYGKSPKLARPFIGWVPQTFHFDRQFPISVEEVVLGGRLRHLSWRGRYSAQDKEAVLKALQQVKMEKALKLPFSSLSGGQAQRVLIARALASDPSLLFLDEPTASVDYKAQVEIYETLQQLKGEMTILMVTHDLDSSIRQMDRLVCIQKNLTEMTPEQVCDHFALGLYHPLRKKVTP